MSLAWPFALIGLLALVVPPIIHLRQRRERTRVTVSVTPFIAETPPTQKWHRQIEHPWLMLLRMALIAAVVMWLAEPFVTDTNDGGTDTWTLVSPAADAARVAALASDPSARWLAPGLPLLSTARPAWKAGQAWSALWAADRAAPGGTSLIVVAPMRAAEIGLRQPVLSRPVRWLDADVDAAQDAVAFPSLGVTVVSDASRRSDAEQLGRLFESWRDAGVRLDVVSASPADVEAITGATVWLSTSPVPPAATTLDTWPVVLVDPAPGDAGQPIGLGSDGAIESRQTLGEGVRIRTVTGGLSAGRGALADPAFAERLLALLFDAGPWQPDPAARLPASVLEPSVDAALVPPPSRSLADLFVVLIVSLLVAERLVAARASAQPSTAA